MKKLIVIFSIFLTGASLYGQSATRTSTIGGIYFSYTGDLSVSLTAGQLGAYDPCTNMIRVGADVAVSNNRGDHDFYTRVDFTVNGDPIHFYVGGDDETFRAATIRVNETKRYHGYFLLPVTQRDNTVPFRLNAMIASSVNDGIIHWQIHDDNDWSNNFSTLRVATNVLVPAPATSIFDGLDIIDINQVDTRFFGYNATGFGRLTHAPDRFFVSHNPPSMDAPLIKFKPVKSDCLPVPAKSVYLLKDANSDQYLCYEDDGLKYKPLPMTKANIAAYQWVFVRSDYQDSVDHQATAVFICKKNRANEDQIKALTSVNVNNVNHIGLELFTPGDPSLKRRQTFYIKQ